MTRSLALALLLLAGGAAGAAAQKPAPKKALPHKEPKLVFDREVFSYPGEGRRDPYTSIVGQADNGPLFENLSLRGIIYAPATGQSLVLLADTTAKKVYRARRGDVLGNARLLDVSQTRVIFSVDNFGVVRQETLELKRNPEGAKG
ncbi:MAG TPA: hypothetical protein VFQ38_18275 [Longimicrobiales bacterium]|nr:hypothetical protein [Longimicrobiales bacterium]